VASARFPPSLIILVELQPKFTLSHSFEAGATLFWHLQPISKRLSKTGFAPMNFLIQLDNGSDELSLMTTEFQKTDGADAIEMFRKGGTEELMVFDWKMPERALCFALLKAFSSKEPTTFRLEGQKGSFASSLYNILRAKQASAHDPSPTWIMKMFLGANACERLPDSLFFKKRLYVFKCFSAGLGRDWFQATIIVRLNLHPDTAKLVTAHKSAYPVFAAAIERRMSFKRYCMEFGILLPILAHFSYTPAIRRLSQIANESCDTATFLKCIKKLFARCQTIYPFPFFPFGFDFSNLEIRAGVNSRLVSACSRPRSVRYPFCFGGVCKSLGKIVASSFP